jgi:Leucine-rich repeat (LRR) protein
MFKVRLSLLILVLMSPLIQAATDCATVTEIPSTECKALVALYNSTGGDNWTRNSGWLETNAPCGWYGVTCNGGRVSKIRLYNNQLGGTIPTELGNLSDLTLLDLSTSWNSPVKLTGTIPTELGNLSNLTRLYLNNNELTGTIPTELGNLSNLTELSLWSNELTGTIPTELGNLSNLTELSLWSNELTGTIPTELGNLSNLTSLDLSWNSLTGTIPTELGNLSNLTRLYLYNNSLTGTIPTELGNLSNLTYLCLDRNELTGTIPTELGNLSNLTRLYLYNNELTGTIPTELGNLSNLTELSLWGNELTGTIPTELGNLSNMQYLFLDNNQLCGEIPTELKNLTNIYLPDHPYCYYESCLDIDNNHLTASDSELIEWLDTYNPGWQTTQTPCPQQQSKLQFASATYNVAEKGGQITITVIRIGSNDGAVSIDYATSDGTATAPDDYTQSAGTLYWSDSDDVDKIFIINIISDSQPENDETFIVNLANPTGGAQLGTPKTATVTITEDNKPFNCKRVSEIPKKECEALVALYDSTNGENWENNTGWKTTNEPCNWNGVTCEKKHVTGLTLWNNNLKGSISKDFFKLKKLKLMALFNNDLNDTSLKNFKKLKSLQTLLIDNCKLTGKIPNSLMKLKNLEELDLNGNCLKTEVSKKLKKWLDEFNPGWDETQTDCQ